MIMGSVLVIILSISEQLQMKRLDHGVGSSDHIQKSVIFMTIHYLLHLYFHLYFVCLEK